MDQGTSRVRFGDIEADLATGDVCRQGGTVRLQEQPRQVLAALLERPGEVVTREVLRERLWKSDTFVDFEHGLNTAIKKLRQALGDSADQPRFVETLARRGYRFIAPVTSAEPVRTAFPAELQPDGPAVEDRAAISPARRVVLALLLLLGVVGLTAWLALLPRASGESPARAPAQLAVLPLRVLAPAGEDWTYLGVGMADAITTRLANVRQIALRPTSAVLPYREAQTDPAGIAAALGVQHLLVGTIQQADNAYRVSVQLVRGDGVAIWGRTYDLPRSGLLRLQDTVAEQVVAALRVELSAPERERLSARHTDNADAYDLYLRGRTLLVNYTEANMRQAIGHFERALMLDPGYALARSALATACAWFSVRYAYQSEAAVWGKRAEDEARRALEQNSSLADAHLAIATAAGTLYRGFDWRTLMTESAEALALDPSLDLAHVTRMRALYHLGLFDDARKEGQRARALNPSPNVETARLDVAIQLFAGDFGAAAERATALMQRTDTAAVRHYLGLSRYYLEDPKGAREMLASVKRGNQADVGYVRAQASLASIEAATGLRTEARARAESIESGGYMDHHVAYSLGAAWAQLNDAAASVRWLRQAAETGFPCYPWFARDTLLDPIRRDPAFTQLMSTLEAQHRAALTH
jgi:DNA-binding winged helix-turn-helix (wHTH) protein/TolB-like protein